LPHLVALTPDCAKLDRRRHNPRRRSTAQEASEVRPSADILLFQSSSKTAWVGTTDKNGIFTANELPPGKYRLEVGRWGSTTIQINPDLHGTAGNKIPLWGLWLSDNSCVLTSISY
jgi:hypothetical protein